MNGTSLACGVIFGTCWLTFCAIIGGAGGGSIVPFGNSPITTRKPTQRLAESGIQPPRFAERTIRVSIE